LMVHPVILGEDDTVVEKTRQLCPFSPDRLCLAITAMFCHFMQGERRRHLLKSLSLLRL
ncbi:Semaphorin-1A, partial [Dissostichus eleginoides]